MFTFLARLLENKYSNSLIARLGANLLMTNLGIAGLAAKAAGPFISGFIGLIMESGVFAIDLTIDSYKEGAKLKEFQKAAKEAYNHASSKVHTPEEKEKIRQQYLAIIGKFAAI